MDECQEETWSWWHFNDQQVDPYWIRCTEVGPHDVHEDAHTGLTWEKEDMNMKPKKFVRKPFEVQAVEVTEENMDAVAKWCSGDIKSGKGGTEATRYIQVDVHRPIHPNQTRAYPGNWILKSGSNFKVYTDKAFKSTFDPAEQPATV